MTKKALEDLLVRNRWWSAMVCEEVVLMRIPSGRRVSLTGGLESFDQTRYHRRHVTFFV